MDARHHVGERPTTLEEVVGHSYLETGGQSERNHLSTQVYGGGYPDWRIA